MAAVLPAYNVENFIGAVLADIPEWVDFIVVVNDGSTDSTEQFVRHLAVSDQRISLVSHKTNSGVGAAVITGFQLAFSKGAQIAVKVDSDGQMNLEDLSRLVAPLADSRADFAKGNRFLRLGSLGQMPKVRIFGNAVLSIMSKFSTGYWRIGDPTNGFLALTRPAWHEIETSKLSPRFFFESDLLHRAGLSQLTVIDIPIDSKYGDEKSNLKVSKIVGPFLAGHARNFVRRLALQYWLREWSIVTFALPWALLMGFSALVLALRTLLLSAEQLRPVSAGEVTTVALLLIIAVQFMLAALQDDMNREPGKDGKAKLQIEF